MIIDPINLLKPSEYLTPHLCRSCDHLKVLKMHEWSMECMCLLKNQEVEMKDDACKQWVNLKDQEEREQKRIEGKNW